MCIYINAFSYVFLGGWGRKEIWSSREWERSGWKSGERHSTEKPKYTLVGAFLSSFVCKYFDIYMIRPFFDISQGDSANEKHDSIQDLSGNCFVCI